MVEIKGLYTLVQVLLGYRRDKGLVYSYTSAARDGRDVKELVYHYTSAARVR